MSILSNEDEELEIINTRQIRFEKSDPTIESLLGLKNHNELVLQPDFQRNFVWNKQKASSLIESILLNFPLPIIYTAQKNEIEEVIDGQQRLISIFSYIQGHFPGDPENKQFKLGKMKVLKEISNKSFHELPEETKRKLFRKTIPFVKVISDDNDLDDQTIKFEMFERINTNITRLNAQELRNCMYRGTYNDFIKELSLSEDFQYILNNPNYKKRMLDVELILMFFAFLNTNYIQFRGNMKQFLNNEMHLRKNLTTEQMRSLKTNFKKSVDLIKAIFGNKGFNVYSIDIETRKGKYASQLNQGLFLILMYGFTPFEKPQIIEKSDLIKEELYSLFIHNHDFLLTLSGSGTNSRENTIKKIEFWQETLRGIVGYPRNNPRAFSFQLKQNLYEQSDICQICHNRINSIYDSEVDHIFCYWRGGLTIPENARLVHRICNRIRGGDQNNNHL